MGRGPVFSLYYLIFSDRRRDEPQRAVHDRHSIGGNIGDAYDAYGPHQKHAGPCGLIAGYCSSRPFDCASVEPEAHSGRSFQSMGLGALNGFVGGSFIMLFLPLFERILDKSTLFRLMELADINAPVLKEMLSNAPGTYAHSMNVAYLAETAAKEVGANPLLARVGAYYHDIGKIEHPEYFTENQKGINRHDEINPTLSASIIRRHVKDGIERARKIGLPKEVIDIIGQHHGNSVMEAIISKAKDSTSETDFQSYRYQGERPKSKEAALVMLADTIEAASRSLKNPNATKLEQLVHHLILHKITSGQLDESALTLHDIGVAEQAFLRILQSQLHTRIEYPGQDKQ